MGGMHSTLVPERLMHRLRGLAHQYVRHVQRFRLQRIALLETLDVDLGIDCAHPQIGVRILRLGCDSLDRFLG